MVERAKCQKKLTSGAEKGKKEIYVSLFNFRLTSPMPQQRVTLELLQRTSSIKHG